MARATAIPTSSIGFSEVPYFGRTIKVAGQRRYDDWLITVINDEGALYLFGDKACFLMKKT